MVLSANLLQGQASPDGSPGRKKRLSTMLKSVGAFHLARCSCAAICSVAPHDFTTEFSKHHLPSLCPRIRLCSASCWRLERDLVVHTD